MTSTMPNQSRTVIQRNLFDTEHDDLRRSFRSFLEREVVPHDAEWERDQSIPAEIFRKAGAAGFLGPGIAEEHSGMGPVDYRFSVVLNEECSRLGLTGIGQGITVHNDVVLPYLLDHATSEQKDRWLPGVASGEAILAVGMTEPGAGSDLAGITTRAVRDGEDYVVNGSKIFITNGINADLVLAAVRTGPERYAGLSLLMIERGMAGFGRGRNLKKLGMHSQDTAELFFSDVRVPATNLVGSAGDGFALMARHLGQERLNTAIHGVAAARAALDMTIEYLTQRTAFGQKLGSFQNSAFTVAEMRTEIEIAQVFVDRCTVDLIDGRLSSEQAAMAKWWCTELQGRVVDSCLQLFGGYGYMEEYPISRFYADARVTRIFAGTTEIMKKIIGKTDGLG